MRRRELLHNRLRLAKEIQLNLWVETCLGLARLGGGRPRDGVHVHTRRVAEADLQAAPQNEGDSTTRGGAAARSA